VNPQTLERTDTPVLELQPRPAQPLAEAPQQRSELSVVQYLVQSGASVEQVQAALELQVRADNHKLEMMREKRRMAEPSGPSLAWPHSMTSAAVSKRRAALLVTLSVIEQHSISSVRLM